MIVEKFDTGEIPTNTSLCVMQYLEEIEII